MKSLFALHDTKLNGFLTWSEKQPEPVGEVIGVLLFTSGELCEEYIVKVMPARADFVSVCKIGKHKMRDFVKQMVRSGVDYGLVNVPPIAVDQFCETFDLAERELVRNYMIVDLKTIVARFGT